jgi:NADH-quinone oxidoreductase subunit H
MEDVFQFHFWMTLIFIAVVMGVLQGTCAYLILAERKISAWAQDRLGPNRVGPWGLLQPIVDGAKFLLKEEVIPAHVDRAFYLLAPAIALATATLAFAVVPFGPTTVPPDRPWPRTVAEERAYDAAHGQELADAAAAYNQTIQYVIAPHVDIGIVFLFAVGSLAAYAVVLGGWSSNNKYSFLGALRSSAQLISYEIPMGMSVLGVMLLSGSLNLETILEHQYRHGWNVLFQPLACLLFITAIFAECNRLPFDLSEAEQELVGGYHTEYSALKFGLFFLGEYTHMITTSFLVSVVFFGGWLLPGVTAPGPDTVGTVVLKIVILGAKMALFIVFFMLVRWTIPRFRYDQLIGLAWKVLIPLALANLVVALVVRHFDLNPWLMLVASVLLLIGSAALTVRIPSRSARKEVAFRGHELPLKRLTDTAAKQST